MMSFRKFQLLALLGGASTIFAGAPALAQPAGATVQLRSFNIPAGGLAAALQAFARQGHVEIIFNAEQLQGSRTAGVKGRYAPRDALNRLLSGTGFSIVQDSSGAYLVKPAPVAQISDDPGPAAFPLEAEQEAIVVTGTRISGVDVTAPTMTVTREELANGGFTTVEEFFESLPQNFDEVTPEGRFANEGGSQLRGANNSRVSAVDLRGLGAQSTLTLVNGTRRAGSVDGRVVDISVIPLSIIERVEIVTGGRSAIYGADAVAGVVNMVTRRDFDGAESQASFGFAEHGGGERLQLSQIVGAKSDRGGFVAAYDFQRDWALELGDAGLLSRAPNPEIGLTQLSLNAQAPTWRHSAFLSGRYEIGSRVEIFADALYSHKKFEDLSFRFFEGGTEDSFTDIHSRNEHLSFSGGARIDMGSRWTLNLSGGWSAARNRQRENIFIDLGFLTLERESLSESEARMATLTAVADGPLFSIGGITPRAALGVEWRREDFERSLDGVEENDDDRNVRSAFAELFIPLVENGETPGLRNLEITLAGRFDDYSDFGDTFNPQAGISWEPVRGLTLRGAYSTAFRAPALVELDSSVDVFIETASDPTQGGALVPILFSQGENSDLGPEEAETWSLGFDFEPAFAPWLRTSFSYFDVRYDGRIEQPSVNADRELVLQRADRFPGLIIRNPTREQAAAVLDSDADGLIDNGIGTPFDPATQDLLTVFPNIILFDNRTSNIAVEKVRGLDFSVDTEFDTGIGRLNFGLNLTHTLDHERKVTAASPAFSLLNEVGKAVDTRFRAKAGWSRGAFSAFAYLNHVASYANPFSTPASRMGSWSTVDLTLRFDGDKLSDAGFLKGVDAALSVRNLFASDPPVFRDSLLGILYDSTNANPFGRFFSLRLTKHW